MTTNNLTFHTVAGVRLAEAPLNGEARAFGAKIQRDAVNAWRLTVTTHGLPLETATRRTLAECRTLAAAIYAVVEGVNA